MGAMSDPTDAGRDAVRTPDPRMISLRVAPPVGGTRRHLQTHAQPPAPEFSSTGRLPVVEPSEVPGDAGVRPFVMTHGRTAPVDERLRVETQVVATRRAESVVLDFECRRIVELCASPLSVAEIGAALGLPLMVARVLVADLASVGAVAVHEQEAAVTRALLERILERVHAL